jgi:hypothetical protein
VILVGTQKTLMLIGMFTVKTVLMRFEEGIRTQLEISLEKIHVTFWQRICLHFVHVLRLCVMLGTKVRD